MTARGRWTGAVVTLFAVAVAGCAGPAGSGASSAPAAATGPAAGGSPGGPATAATGSQPVVRSKDGRLAFALPAHWVQRPCPVAGDDCAVAAPSSGAPGEQISASFTGLNPANAGPLALLCAPTGAALHPDPATMPSITRISVGAHRAFRMSTRGSASAAAAGTSHAYLVMVLVCLDGGASASVPLGLAARTAWLNCGLASDTPTGRQICDHAVATLQVQP
ncbi:MAG TPA: hypothetical protein VI248_21150 [Kineosporiaceae bacterium]